MLDCGEYPLLNNTHLTLVNGTVYDSLVAYSCPDHHVYNNDLLQTETHTVCTEHGNWGQIMYPEGCKGVLQENIYALLYIEIFRSGPVLAVSCFIFNIFH